MLSKGKENNFDAEENCFFLYEEKLRHTLQLGWKPL